MRISKAVTAIVVLWPIVGGSAVGPTVTLQNGSYQGVHNNYYNVDAFLAMPFSQPPVGNLRLALPVPLNSTFSGVRNATELGPACVQFSAATINRPISEDCLTINVYRPSGYENGSLPVLVWIFGGGYIQGSNYDPRYNLTFIVNESARMGKPIIAANINYRLNGFGFLDGPVIREAGLSNIGLYDQRLALSWVQENIGSFGGDPTRVTIWGQSAGAGSVLDQLLAFGGRNDSLFRAAIADSIGIPSITANTSLATWNSILNLTSCTTANDALGCLRGVSTEVYTQAVNHTSGSYGPVFDGIILETYSSEQMKAGQFLRVPLLTGSNTDEGTNFVGGAPSIGAAATVAYPNETSFLNVARSYIRNSTAMEAALAALSVLYPDVPSIGIPHSYHGRLDNATFGAQYKRVAALAGDFTIHRNRRLAAQSWAAYDVPVYSYHFNQWPIGGLPDFTGTTHFTEIQLLFDNEGGNGYVAPWYQAGSEFSGQDFGFYILARLMSKCTIFHYYCVIVIKRDPGPLFLDYYVDARIIPGISCPFTDLGSSRSYVDLLYQRPHAQ
ncbi:Alpha/Beta hydrolase protein [Xylariales sp. PMI_506]|nr:Alpha/Beta hydrolase protein [Xylariales sp. PMI_506]